MRDFGCALFYFVKNLKPFLFSHRLISKRGEKMSKFDIFLKKIFTALFAEITFNKQKADKNLNKIKSICKNNEGEKDNECN